MIHVATAAFVVACGLVFAGLTGSLMELWAGRRLDLREPFVTRQHVWRSLMLTAAAGPFMLVNTALERAQGGTGDRLVVFSALIAAFWIVASGVVVADLAFRIAGLLS
ncbi:hypothetical protein FQ775_10830 [Nitratireductor mangrovi]|uniref:DUF2269 family protein n=1 Tax=Nitratireductor mangrovi TaxID=2599600 RepID=A0A5B8KYP0_9HYPH|nr:hypothetical protein [Nitratireductor mangrovi]QDZ00837.1 hypothetical protein FQ775_10830 [Nitratireductor mangrovi]